MLRDGSGAQQRHARRGVAPKPDLLSSANGGCRPAAATRRLSFWARVTERCLDSLRRALNLSNSNQPSSCFHRPGVPAVLLPENFDASGPADSTPRWPGRRFIATDRQGFTYDRLTQTLWLTPECLKMQAWPLLERQIILTQRIEQLVKLRDHPQMTRRDGVKVWPPRWVAGVQPAARWPTGEVGTLQEVSKPENLDSYLFLTIEYDGLQYFGIVHFDDPKFCEDMYNLLQSKMGCSIKEIGDLYLLRTL
jgi:hypothetical protein